MTAAAAAPSAPSGGGARVAWALFRCEPWAWLAGAAWWTLFHSLPVATGFALGLVLDAIDGGADPSPTLAALALLAGFETARWTMFLAAVVQWHGAWVGWQSRARLALLDSLVTDPGPAEGRLPGGPGEAVSRFRDDTDSIALVLDVWLDVIGTLVAAAIALTVLATVDPRLALGVAVPALVVVVVAHSFGPLLRRWRLAARDATARVTGFLGDTFGAIGSVKAVGGEEAVVSRFARLGDARARHAVRDEVGTQLLYTLSGTTADVALALALVVIAPAAARGEVSVGDLGLVAAYSTVVASVPRFVGRMGAYHRQADVSAVRLQRLLPPGRREPDAVAGDVEMRLRAHRSAPADAAVGPAPGEGDPDLAPRRPADAVSRHPSRACCPLAGLRAEGLTVRHDGVVALVDVDVEVRPGEVVAVTGPVGSGKSSLVRGLLGLIPAEGSLWWDDEPVVEPSRVLVPPRVAYVPQVPRLFSEPLADAVLLGLPRSRLAPALHLACLERDLEAMPRSTATVVGSRGVRLSGGQVQRVAAARALARQARLLVVDDLSSALDAATEAELWRRILTAADLDGTAVLVVTHRPAVLDQADRTVRLDAGRQVG